MDSRGLVRRTGCRGIRIAIKTGSQGFDNGAYTPPPLILINLLRDLLVFPICPVRLIAASTALQRMAYL